MVSEERRDEAERLGLDPEIGDTREADGVADLRALVRKKESQQTGEGEGGQFVLVRQG